MRMIILAAAAILVVSAARASQTYNVENWPADVDAIPCSAWEHYPDGSWGLHGSIKVGASVLDDIGFKGSDASARMLDKKCGKK